MNTELLGIYMSILTVLLLLIIVVFNNDLLVRKYIIKTDKVKKSIRIALITDLHSCKYGEQQKVLINKIKEQNPNLILYGGDIIDDKLPEYNGFILVEELAKLYPCSYVSGNHEFVAGNIDYIKQEIMKYGVNILAGNSISYYINNEFINICGIDDPIYYGILNSLNQIDESIKDINHNRFTILLTHRPELINNYKKYDFDLILAGHAHGGQWRLPGIINGLFAPSEGLFPKYAGGEYKFGEKTFIVSRGLAKESTKVPRIFNRPEVVIIDIMKK